MEKEFTNQQNKKPYVKAEAEIVEVDLRIRVMAGSGGTGGTVNDFELDPNW